MPRASWSAFAALTSLGYHAGVLGGVSWVVPMLLVSIGMSLLYASWGWSETGIMLLGGVAAGVVVGTTLGYRLKIVTAEVREALCADLPDPKERAALIRLIQSQPKAYRLEGQRRLHHHVALEAPEARAPAAGALLATLSGTPP